MPKLQKLPVLLGSRMSTFWSIVGVDMLKLKIQFGTYWCVFSARSKETVPVPPHRQRTNQPIYDKSMVSILKKYSANIVSQRYNIYKFEYYFIPLWITYMCNMYLERAAAYVYCWQSTYILAKLCVRDIIINLHVYLKWAKIYLSQYSIVERRLSPLYFGRNRPKRQLYFFSEDYGR